ncbi:MAG: DNA repair protein RecO [Candidatus Moranbacteria bacterium RIFCSPHIGHO2_12_FULL_54_9]|nr:MAG: DNA repair protein RecO [Candidatus Moranbacteria bacterium RIFCSPHIGHO2_12_FULL_54_9]
MEIRYSAIVLKKKEVGETDRLYTLYTLEQGKVQLVAKGVRKSEAKLAGQLETLMQGLVIVVKGRGTGKIAGAVAEKNFLSLRTDVDVLKRVLETVNMFERLVGWDEPDAELFQLLATYLGLTDDAAQDDKKEKIWLLTEGFLFQLFAHLGYRIETGVCAVSGARLKSGEQHFFSPSAGGIFAGQHTHDTKNSFPISENAIKLIRLFLSNRLDTLERVQATSQELRETQQIASRFFQWIDN